MNILIIGLGSIARKHIAALRNIDPEVNIAALRSSRQSIPEPFVRDVFTIEEAKMFAPDFIIISTPTASHVKSIRMALQLNVQLFIEKPLIHTLEDAGIVSEIEESGVLNYVACNLRFLGCLDFVKKAVENRGKRVNEVNCYCGSWLPGWRQGVDFRNVYSSRPDMGGGVHIDLIHEIDYVYWLFGMPDSVVSVLRNKSSLDIESVDYANYCLSYPDFCASVILNYFRRDYKRTLEIVWEDTTWNVDMARNRITEGDRVIFESSQTILDTYEVQLRYFIDLVKERSRHSFNDVKDALNTLGIALS